VNDPRKHHYVPIVYQNNFVNAEGLLWVYDRKLQTYKELHPRKICCEKDLYSIRPEGKPKDQRLESDALAGMDGVCATAIRQIVAGVGKLPARSTIEVIAQFVGLQYSRVPSMREFVTSSWEAHTKESMRLRAVNEDRMQSTIDRYVEETGETIEASAKTMVEVVRRGGLKVVVTEVPFLRHIFSTGQMVSQTVMQTSWQVLIASPDSGFISCATKLPSRFLRARNGYLRSADSTCLSAPQRARPHLPIPTRRSTNRSRHQSEHRSEFRSLYSFAGEGAT
jgi:hypothetical protein